VLYGVLGALILLVIFKAAPKLDVTRFVPTVF
jgi:hypothetical protein